ncbi:hypothetical protein D3C72_1407030 [compost metagenome]
MVVAAGVDAAADVDAHRAEFFQQGGVGQLVRQGLGHGDGAGVGQAAIVQAGAGDDVGGQVGVGGGQTGRAQSAPDPVGVLQPDVGQDQVLFVGGPDLVEREACGQIGDHLHLIRGDVARHAVDGLQ